MNMKSKNILGFLGTENQNLDLSWFPSNDIIVLDDIDASSAVDAVYLSVPLKNRFEAIKTLLEKGKHVIVVPPIASSKEEAKELFKIAKEKKLILRASAPWRYREDSKAIKDYVSAGTLGNLYYSRAQSILRRPSLDACKHVFMNKPCDGALYDLGTSALDLFMFLSNKLNPTCVISSSYDKIEENYEDFSVSLVQFGPECAVTLEAAWAINSSAVRPIVCTLCGTNAGTVQNADFSYSINYSTNGQLVTERPTNFWETSLSSENLENVITTARFDELKAFISDVTDGYIMNSNEDLDVSVAGVISAIAESARKNAPVVF